ncbi:transcriptional regulator [Peribacillus butanolivorans]|uniref:ArpU family phage packaging/lysis transcriptional regulator n=1 Tax=Peribacillus butanolivorans TaxID=421767 RepID=UPI0006A6BD8B|nr:ArpU family phage packaging/lysis transcriptional regulator [Peribacillus butanolivorans]KON69922.1 transcriptional regulator [Peribacillus butanolivorans]
MSFELPELDRKETQKALEETLKKYRLYKYLLYEEREASVTSSPEVRYHGPTNQTGDQTGSIAIYNTDQQTYRKNFCKRLECAVSRLPKLERFLIEERYMQEESDYLTDYNVYCFKFQPAISEKTYSKIRWKAFYKVALNLNIAVLINKEV